MCGLESSRVGNTGNCAHEEYTADRPLERNSQSSIQCVVRASWRDVPNYKKTQGRAKDTRAWQNPEAEPWWPRPDPPLLHREGHKGSAEIGQMFSLPGRNWEADAEPWEALHL